MRAIRPADQNEASIGITPMCLLLLAFITQLTGCGQAPEGTISDLQGCQAAADCIRDVPEQEQEQEQEPAPEPNPEPETAPDTPPVNPCPRCEPVELDCDYDQANVHFHDPIQLESDSLPAGARANDIIVDFIDGDAHRDIAVF
jgi:hypothetical protein